jgi:radical SAM protein with 4Fe4S-binding SPASM domain
MLELSLGIEIINICNYKCYFCGSQFVDNHKILSNEKYFSIINEAKSAGIKHLDLTPMDGELFVDKHFMEKLKKTLEDFSVEFFTNFSLCTPKIQDELKKLQDKYKLIIRVSDYGDGDKEYFKYQTRKTDKDWDIYRNNLDYANKIGLELDLHYRGKDHNFVFDNTNTNIEEKYKIKGGERKINTKGVCKYQFTPRIDIEGNLMACLCGDSGTGREDELFVGNIYEEGFKEVYFSKKRLEMFLNHSKGIYSETCKTCELFEIQNIKIDILKMYSKIKENK